jgi:acetate kinase
MSKTILVINCGSSSLKFALFDIASQQQLASGLAERLGDEKACLTHSIPEQNIHKQSKIYPNADHEKAISEVMAIFSEAKLTDQLAAVGHRVVHGAEAFRESSLITQETLNTIKKCIPLAPLHNPANIIGIESIQHLMPTIPQVAVFDTAFHQSLPEHAYLYPIPYSLYREQRVRRYGFHGTSHKYVCEQAAEALGKPLADMAFLSAHLGNGCSATAVLGGKSVDTTMGLTPLEGLVMGTRSGDVDPGLHKFLADSCGYSLNEINDLLNKKSGVLGLSELSNDMRELKQASAEGHRGAQLAIEVFCYRLAKQLAGLSVALGRIDALIFTGGIGENDADMRARTGEWLSILGIEIDPERNQQGGKNSGGQINGEKSAIKTLVIATNEELKIALDTAKFC